MSNAAAWHTHGSLERAVMSDIVPEKARCIGIYAAEGNLRHQGSNKHLVLLELNSVPTDGRLMATKVYQMTAQQLRVPAWQHHVDLQMRVNLHACHVYTHMYVCKCIHTHAYTNTVAAEEVAVV